jgi:hypothetical protein
MSAVDDTLSSNIQREQRDGCGFVPKLPLQDRWSKEYRTVEGKCGKFR